MLELIEALDGHVKHNGVELEVQLPEGSWDDIRRLVEPMSEAWTEIGDLCNRLALDDGYEDGQRDSGYTSNYERGKSDLAHGILRIIAQAEKKVQDRN